MHRCRQHGGMGRPVRASAFPRHHRRAVEPAPDRWPQGRSDRLVQCEGEPGHSSQPDRYVNAVMAAGDMIAFINRIRAEMRDGPQAEGFDPPWSTIQVKLISGGLHGNIVADACRFFWRCAWCLASTT